MEVTLRFEDRFMRFAFRANRVRPVSEFYALLPRTANNIFLSAIETPAVLTVTLRGQEIRYPVPIDASQTYRTCTRDLRRERIERRLEEMRQLVQ